MTTQNENNLNEIGKTYTWSEQEAEQIASEYSAKYSRMVAIEDVSTNKENITWQVMVMGF